MNQTNQIQMPRHVAIIMDGSGRWAKSKNKPRKSGHNAGALAVRKTIEFAVIHQIESLSLYAFSKENWKRPQAEIDHLMKLFTRVLRNNKKFLMKNNVQLRAIGDIQQFDPQIINALQKLIADTSTNTGLILNVALNYSGQWDIANAFCNIYSDSIDHLISKIQATGKTTFSLEEVTQFLNSQKVGLVDRDQIALVIDNEVACADQAPIDLIIRTSNEQRLSNFFLWQAAYSEFLFLKEYWPDFTHQTFMQAIEEFNKRTRRFGGLNAGEE